jgi:GNAT superfamily N-acetyltransferase
MLKIATLEDFDTVFDLAMKFSKASNYDKFVDPEKVKGMINIFLTADQTDKLILLYGDVGMLVAATTPFIFGGQKMATEIAWWVEPSERKNGVGDQLLQAFEHWAKKIGCKMVTMTSLDDNVGKFYETRDYVLYERAYFKEI